VSPGAPDRGGAPDPGLALQPDPERLTLPRFLEDVTARHGERTALVHRGSRIRYRELAEAVRRAAAALVAAGVVKGARVGLLLPNRPDFVVELFAATALGAVVVPVNTFARPGERDHILRHGDVSLLLMTAGLAGRDYRRELLEAHPELATALPGRLRLRALPQLRRIVCLDGPGEGGIEGPEALSGPAPEAEALLPELAREIHPSDDALLIYTSGTTALPKGVIHRQRAPVIQSWRFAEHLRLDPSDRVLTTQPFFWTAGLCMSLGASLAAGAELHLQERFVPEEVLACIEEEGITALFAWPHQEQALGEHPEVARRKLHTLRRIRFGTPLAERAGLRENRWGPDASYGLSETFTIVSSLPADTKAQERAACSGRPLPGCEIRIVDPKTGVHLPPGAHGEIAVRGLTLMRGYAKVDPELVFDPDGFFRTGDGGSLDEEGRLHWTGRLTRLIKTGGANVSPLEVEEALRGFPGIQEAAALGVPHPTLGEALVLCAVAAGGPPPGEAEVLAHLRERLAAYKVPRRVLFLDPGEVSRTGTDKLQVAALRERALQRLAEEGAEIAGHRYGGDG